MGCSSVVPGVVREFFFLSNCGAVDPVWWFRDAMANNSVMGDWLQAQGYLHAAVWNWLVDGICPSIDAVGLSTRSGHGHLVDAKVIFVIILFCFSINIIQNVGLGSLQEHKAGR